MAPVGQCFSQARGTRTGTSFARKAWWCGQTLLTPETTVRLVGGAINDRSHHKPLEPDPKGNANHGRHCKSWPGKSSRAITGRYAPQRRNISACNPRKNARRVDCCGCCFVRPLHTRGGVLNELALFAGAGGGILAGHLLGWRTVCAVERDAHAAQVLAQRQNDGALRPFPIWSDVCSFDGRQWRGIVDVISGGFPCQDISVAGPGTGLAGARSGLWSEFRRIVGEVRPRFVFIENSPALITRGLAVVLADLASIGFDARWTVLSAGQLGACHVRDRAWIVAHSPEVVGQARPRAVEQPRQLAMQPWDYSGITGDSESLWVEMASEFRRMDDGVANSVERTEAIGNGQVPAVGATAWQILARSG